MRKPQGYYVIVEPDKAATEGDTFTCFHCQRVVNVPPKADPSTMGGFCRVCMRLICGPCADKGSCTPWEKQMEAMEKRDRFRRSLERGFA